VKEKKSTVVQVTQLCVIAGSIAEKMPYRNIHAPFRAKMASEAHGTCGKPIGNCYQSLVGLCRVPVQADDSFIQALSL
jgi:hypothetical protein